MNLKDVNILSKLKPSTRFLIKRILQSTSRLLGIRLLGNPYIADKLFPQAGGKNGFVINDSTYKIDGYDEYGLAFPSPLYTHGHPDKGWFWESGKEDVDNMINILVDSGIDLTILGHVLDFGCASGRLIRHLYKHKDTEIWGCDISAEHIGWCKEYLSPPFNFITNTTSPHLPFEDGYFSFIYAGSVFTHIDDLADMWFLELKRILQKGGVLYITIHDDSTLDIFKEIKRKDKFASAVINSKEYSEYERSNGKMFVIGRSVYSQVFYNTEYLSRILKDNFELLSVTPKAYRDIQTAYLLRNS